MPDGDTLVVDLTHRTLVVEISESADRSESADWSEAADWSGPVFINYQYLTRKSADSGARWSLARRSPQLSASGLSI